MEPQYQVDLFQKSNIWINGCYNLPKITELVVDLLADKVDPSADTLGVVSITAGEMNDLIQSNSVWSRLKELSKSLKEVSVEVWSDEVEEYLAVNFFSTVRSRTSRKHGFRISVEWNDQARGFILHKRRNYTGVSKQVKAALNGKYSRRLYELCRQFIGTGWYNVEMEELKAKVKGEKLIHASYVERMLERATEEINSLDICDYTLSFTMKKRRGLDHMIYFKVHRKLNRFLPPTPVESFKMTPEEWLADLEQNHPEEFRQRYKQENVVAAASLWDETPEAVDKLTRSRMMKAYSERIKDQLRRAS